MNEEDKSNQTINFGATQIGSLFSNSQANGTDTLFEGMNLFLKEADRLKNVGIPQKQGNLFEYIEAAKFNFDAAVKGSQASAHITAAEGSPHDAADIVIREGKKIVDKVQLKSYADNSDLAFGVSESKYSGMQKVVPSDKVDRVRELAEKRANTNTLKADDYRDTSQNLTGELKHGDVSSKGTTYQENLEAAQNPDSYALKLKLQAVGKEVAVTAGAAAIAGSLVGGAISAIKHSVSVNKGEITVQEALQGTAVDAGVAGVRSGLTGALSVGVRHTANSLGVTGLAKSNIATAVAAGLVDVGVTVFRFAKGEISVEEAMQRVGHTGASTIGGIYGGLAVGVTFGAGAPALIGSVAGYMVVSNVYQSCIAIFNNADLAEQEAERVIALCEEACKQMGEQRAEFEQLLTQALEIRKDQFAKCFTVIDASLGLGDPELTTLALADFAALFGKELQFKTFDEFNAFMNDDDSTLVL